MDALATQLDGLQKEIQKLSLANTSLGLPKPPNYDGSTPFDIFLRTFNRIATGHGWDYTRCTQVLPLYLIGEARAVYDQLPDEDKKNWKSLTTALTTRTIQKNVKDSARRLLVARKQKSSESLTEFALVLKDLATKAFPPSSFPAATSEEDRALFIDEMTRDYFRMGLLPELKEKVLYMEVPSTMKEALEQAKGVAEIRDSLQRDINAVVDSEARQLLENVQAEICVIRNEIAGHMPKKAEETAKRTFGGNNANTEGKRPSRPCPSCGQKNHWRKDCRQRNATCHKCKKVGHIAKICRSSANSNGESRGRNYGRNQNDQRQNANSVQPAYPFYHFPTWQPHPPPNWQPQNPPANSGHSNQPINSVTKSRSPSPILWPFMACLTLLFLQASAQNHFQICPNKLNKLIELPTPVNCSIENSARMKNHTFTLFLPKSARRSFTVFRCYSLVTKICTLHYSLYWHQEDPVNFTGEPPSSRNCTRLAHEAVLEQKSENLWWTNIQPTVELSAWGEHCKNTTNYFVEVGQGIVEGENVVTNWGTRHPYIHSGERDDITQDFVYLWNNADPAYWHTHQKIGPLEGTVINERIFVIPSLEYALFRNENQSFSDSRGVPRDAVRVQNEAFIKIEDKGRPKRESEKRQVETKPPRTKIPLSPKTPPPFTGSTRPTLALRENSRRTPPPPRQNSRRTEAMSVSLTSQSTQTMSHSTNSMPSSTTSRQSSTTSIPSSTTSRPSSTTSMPSSISSSTSTTTTVTVQTTHPSEKPRTTPTSPPPTTTQSRPSTVSISEKTTMTLTTNTSERPRTTLTRAMPTTTLIRSPTTYVSQSTTKTTTLRPKTTSWTAKTQSQRTTLLTKETKTQSPKTTMATKASVYPKQASFERERAEMAKQILELKVQLDQLARSHTSTPKSTSKRSVEERGDLHLNSKLNYQAVKQDLKLLDIWNQQCLLRNNQVKSVIAMARNNPTAAARLLFGRNDLIAKWDPSNSSRLFIGQCTTIRSDRVFWGRKVNGICYDSLPILVKKQVVFIKPGTKDVMNNATVIPCDEIEPNVPANKANFSEEWNPANPPSETDAFIKGRVVKSEKEEKDEAIQNFRYRAPYSEKPKELAPMNVGEAIETMISNTLGQAKAIGGAAIDTAVAIKNEGVKTAQEAKENYEFWKSAWTTAKWLVPTILMGVGVLLICFLLWKFRIIFQISLTVLGWMTQIAQLLLACFRPRRTKNPKYIAAIRPQPSAPSDSLLEEDVQIINFIPQINAVGNDCHITLHLNGKPIKALFDCGAGLSYGRKTAALRCGLQIRPSGFITPARAANGTPIYFVGRVEAMVEMGSFKKIHTFLISEDNDCPDEFIIGTDIMREINKAGHQIGLNFLDGEVQIGDIGCPMIAGVKQEEKLPEIRVLNDEILDPRSDNVIMAYTKEDIEEKDEFLTVPWILHRTKSLAVGNCLIKPDKSKSFPIRIMNMGKSAVKLFANTRVGNLRKFLAVATMVSNIQIAPGNIENIPVELQWMKNLPGPSDAKTFLPISQQLDFNGSILSPAGMEKVKQLVDRHKEAFVLEDGKIGTFQGETLHKIELVHGAVPPRQRPYRIPYAIKPEAERQLKEMLAQKIIRPSASAFAAPMMMIKKADGKSFRMVIDYRQLNAITKKQVYILPNIQDLTDSLVGKSIFSTFDMMSGFYQIPMDPKHTDRTAFITEFGLFEYLKLPMGLSGAPHSFQLAMNELKHELSRAFCIYLDDAILASESEECHLPDLENYLQVMKKRGLKLRPDKCKIGFPEIRYLGFIISKEGVKIDPKKTEAINKLTKPRTLTQLRSLIGALTYLRRFVPNFASHMQPLYELTKDNRNVWDWGPIQEQALEKLKQLITTAPVLAPPRFNEAFKIETDASTEGLGACLMQKDSEGHDHPIAFYSRSLNRHEKKYHPVELEALALVAALLEFRPYIEGGETTTIVTDCSGLKGLLTSKANHGRLARFQIAIQSFDIDIKHRAGKENLLADYLSRYPPIREKKRRTVAPVKLQPKLSWEEIKRAQRSTKFVQEALEALKEKERNPDFHLPTEFETCLLRKDVLCKSVNGENRVWIPHSLRQRLIDENHACPLQGAHLNAQRTLQNMQKRFTWKGMTDDVTKAVKACETCQKRKAATNNTTREPLVPISPSSGPWSRVHIDLMGPLQSCRQHKYILSIVDSFSKFLIAVPLREQTAVSVANALLKSLICRFGVPTTVVSDCGTQLTSELFSDLAKLLGFQLKTTTPYHQSANGQVERQNKTIAEMLSTTSGGKDWPDFLPYVCFAYNTSVNSVTKQTPFFVTHGFDPKCPSDLQLAMNEPAEFTDMSVFVQETATKLKQSHRQVRESLAKAAKGMKTTADERRRAIESSFYPQQLVLLKKELNELGAHRKFAEKYKGPFRITEVERPNLRIRQIDSNDTFLIHMDKVKPFREAYGLPLRKEDQSTSKRYADKNVEESDSDRDRSPDPPPRLSEREWETISVRRDDESDGLEWAWDEDEIQLNAISLLETDRKTLEIWEANNQNNSLTVNRLQDMPIIPRFVLCYLSVFMQKPVDPSAFDEDDDNIPTAPANITLDDLDPQQKRRIENAWTFQGEQGLRRELGIQLLDVDKYLRRMDAAVPDWRHLAENDFLGDWGEPDLPGDEQRKQFSRPIAPLEGPSTSAAAMTYSRSTTIVQTNGVTIESSRPANWENPTKPSFRLSPNKIRKNQAAEQEKNAFREERERQKAEAKQRVQKRKQEEEEERFRRDQQRAERHRQKIRQQVEQIQAPVQQLLDRADEWVAQHAQQLRETAEIEEQNEQHRNNRNEQMMQEINRREERRANRVNNRALRRWQVAAVKQQLKTPFIPLGGRLQQKSGQPLLGTTPEAAKNPSEQPQQSDTSNGPSQQLVFQPSNPPALQPVILPITHLMNPCAGCATITLSDIAVMRNFGHPANNFDIPTLLHAIVCDFALRNSHFGFAIATLIEMPATTLLQEITNFWKANNFSPSKVLKESTTFPLVKMLSAKCHQMERAIEKRHARFAALPDLGCAADFVAGLMVQLEKVVLKVANGRKM